MDPATDVYASPSLIRGASTAPYCIAREDFQSLSGGLGASASTSASARGGVSGVGGGDSAGATKAAKLRQRLRSAERLVQG